MNKGIDYEKQMEEFESELSKMVGLEDLKLQLRKWAKGLVLDQKRRAMGINLGREKTHHMAFLGNPGTGKITVARVMSKLLHSVGVLHEDKVTQVQRSDLVSIFRYETRTRTGRKMDEAAGGVLFIDEAYRLYIPESSEKVVFDYKDALDLIMSVLEYGNPMVIFAGCTESMKSAFSSNREFRERVAHFYEFDDFSCHELTEIVMIKMNKQDEKSSLFGFKLHPLCIFETISEVIEKNSTKILRNSLNGRLVDQMLNNAKTNLDSRLSINTTNDVDEVMTITVEDLVAGLRLVK